jgi:Mor family transcriptional regulator
MKYRNAKDIFPQHLLEEIRKYIGEVGEELIYFSSANEKKKWGSISGKREEIEHRNKSIRYDFEQGMKIQELEKKYFLSQDTLRKIIYTKSR